MTPSMSLRGLALLLVAVACGAPKPEADTTNALAAVDTLKPAAVTDSLPPADSTQVTGATGATGATGTKTTPAKTTTTTKIRGDTTKILGRDSVIMPKGKGGLPPIKPDSL